MIEIHRFSEMAEQHRQGKLPFRMVQEVAYVLLGLCNTPRRIPPDATAITPQEIDWLLALPEDIDFLHFLGGWVYLCQSEDDLAQVTSMDYDFAEQHGRWPNCTEAVLAWDEAKYLGNADGSADYALLFAATNNAGGHSWFVPRSLWDKAQIDAQIQANHAY